MFNTRFPRFRQMLLLGTSLLLLMPGLAKALSESQFVSYPPTTNQNTSDATPLVMLLLGKDDNLYKKAYTDLVDLNNDGTIDTTYTNSINYYGYFNSDSCYVYNATNQEFEVDAGATNHYCDKSLNKDWSGNFLNWATMTRMDILRKVLYGGYRSTDTSSKTVLERAYFPTDAHSFAKYYDGSDLGSLTPFNGVTNAITMCNTTPATSGDSQNVTNPPLLRVANGDFSKWAANERWQCTWDGEKTTDPVSPHTPTNDNDPSKSTDGLTSNGAGPDYVVRVEVCDNNLLNASNCSKYPNGNYKPTGILQTYGANDSVLFGLMTGSYTKSKSGGVLRKNISPFSTEIDPTDGTFTDKDTIVSTINDLRMHGYNNSDGKYNDDDSCPWGLSSFTEPACSNWGNPMSEMYLEALRYFNGQQPDPDFSTDDSSYIPGVNGQPGLSTATWTPPLTKANHCAKCSIIVLNTGPFSYDSDQLGGFSNLTGSSGTTVAGLTNQIGDWEKITGNTWFIGDNGTLNDGLCTPKVITDLSQALGPCPDAPRLGGSYDIAGLAYWGHTNNLNPADTNADQTVTTYAVSLSASTPVINIPVPNSTTNQVVKFMPACRDDWSTDSQTPGDCRIVDMQIINKYTLSGGTATGEIYLNWEDSEQGGDYDQDMWGTYSYSIDSSGITITTQVPYMSTGYRMGFGYVLAGTVNDGFHVTSGINGFTYSDSSIPNSCGSSTNPNCDAGAAAQSAYYQIGSSTVGTLHDPLWYAAKYGGFTGGGTGATLTTSQWDSQNNTTGAPGADGIPDNYFNSKDPGQLETNLSNVMANISQKVASGTAAAVIANSGSSAGMLVQALYQPLVTHTTNTQVTQQVTWVGMLHSLFLDPYNNLRENWGLDPTGTPAYLGNIDSTSSAPSSSTTKSNGTYGTQFNKADFVVKITYNKNKGETEFQRYTTTDGVTLTPYGTPQPLSALHTIWSARDQLAAIPNSDIPTQRSYNAQIGTTSTGYNGRYIITALNTGNDNDLTKTVDFTASEFDSSNAGPGWLDIQTDFNGDGVIDDKDAADLVNFIRGEDGLDNFRSRTIDYDSTNKTPYPVWRLGDIIHSSPLIVASPSSAYDNRYSDSTYTAFQQQYSDRRTVIYVGGNDGMLHAFNGGFFDSKFDAYCTQPPDPKETSACTPKVESPEPAADPLGSELWAYVPGNLLPQLQWLADPNYQHVYYVDGKPQAFDVDIFNHDAEHPGGWGTILVVGMRLGGGPITYTPVSGGASVTTHSAYIIMDITDPKNPPVLLGEISAPFLGYTTSTPSLMVDRVPSTSGDFSTASPNNWYLVFGSGPNILSSVTSDQNAHLYVLNLALTNGKLTGSFASGFPLDLGISNSFVGDIGSVDWTNNFVTDAAYFGIAGTGVNSSNQVIQTGQLDRLVTNENSSPTNWSVSTVINPSQPFLNKPTFAQDDQGKWWVYAGTGRLLASADNTDDNQQSFYGIKEQVDSSTGQLAGTTACRSSTSCTYYLQDTTGVKVASSGALTDTQHVLPTTVTNFYGTSGLLNEIDGLAGWYIDFPTTSTNGGSGSDRNLGPSVLFRQLELFTTYTPTANSCSATGSSTLYAVYYKTGTQYPGTGVVTPPTCNTCSVTVSETKSLGSGLTAEVQVYSNASGGVCTGSSCGTALSNSSTGAIPQVGVNGVGTPSGRQSWREIIPQ